MKFNFVSEYGDGIGFATHLQSEGHEVKFWLHDKEGSEVGEGLVPKVGDFLDLIDDADGSEIFIFDTSGHGVHADYLRSKGFAVVGGSVLADKLERDREYAMQVMIESEIDIPETHHFESYEDALNFVENSEERWVYKPDKMLGDLSGSHVAYDQEDLLDYLKNVQEYSRVESPQFELQKYEKGLEISSEGWFDGDRWLPLFNHTFERKQLMDGNNGPSGGCTGNVTWACNGECPVCENGVRKLEKFLRENRYRGPIDLNAIITEDSLYGLEFTPRFGYDATPTLLWELLDDSLGTFFKTIAKGAFGNPKESFGFNRQRLAGSIKISIPPWPTEKHNAKSNVPILGLDKADLAHTSDMQPTNPLQFPSVLRLFASYRCKHDDEVRFPEYLFRAHQEPENKAVPMC